MLGIDAGLPPLPAAENRLGFLEHYAEASARRLELLTAQTAEWFAEETRFFDVLPLAGVGADPAHRPLGPPPGTAHDLPAAPGPAASLHLRPHRRHRRPLPAGSAGDLPVRVGGRAAGGGTAGQRGRLTAAGARASASHRASGLRFAVLAISFRYHSRTTSRQVTHGPTWRRWSGPSSPVGCGRGGTAAAPRSPRRGGTRGRAGRLGRRLGCAASAGASRRADPVPRPADVPAPHARQHGLAGNGIHGAGLHDPGSVGSEPAPGRSASCSTRSSWCPTVDSLAHTSPDSVFARWVRRCRRCEQADSTGPAAASARRPIG